MTQHKDRQQRGQKDSHVEEWSIGRGAAMGKKKREVQTDSEADGGGGGLLRSIWRKATGSQAQ